jgi:hypothetical protein
MNKALREPLVHFLLIGAALFAMSELLPKRGVASPADIVVTEGKIEDLAAVFERVWRRPPTPEEMDQLIQEHVREEVLYREGLALGLDRDDTVIRRRIRQKIEFMVEDSVDPSEPTDAELQAFLEAHPETFVTQPRYSFRQVYLEAGPVDPEAEAEADRLLQQLGDPSVDASGLGNRSMLAHAYSDLRAPQAARSFGTDFSEALAELPLGRWTGPIASGYGLHLVRVDQVTPSRMPDLAEVRSAVAREWSNARRAQVRDRFFEQVESKYRITIERPE